MPAILTRREVLAVSAAAAFTTRCGMKTRLAPSRVSIVRVPEYDQRLYEAVRRIFSEHRVDVRGRNVVIKPNLVEFEAGASINTHPMVVHAAFEALRSMGAAEVRIAEGPGHRRSTLDLADAAGYFQTIPRFEEVFVDLNLDDVTRIRRNRFTSRLEKLYLANTVLGADLLVSLPKMKTHHWVGATLSMKNLFGVVPGGVYGWPKNVLHWAGISECIVDLHAVFPRQFAIVDGIIGMEGDGPIHGTPKKPDLLVAGTDPVAVDATCCRIMGIDPFNIPYLRLVAGDSKFRILENNIWQIGVSIADVATRFKLPSNLPKLA